MKTCLMPSANNKGANQPVQSDQHHFARCLDSRIPTHAKTRISMLQLVSVAEEARCESYLGGNHTFCMA